MAGHATLSDPNAALASEIRKPTITTTQKTLSTQSDPVLQPIPQTVNRTDDITSDTKSPSHRPPEKAGILSSFGSALRRAHTVLQILVETEDVVLLADTLHGDPDMVIPDPTTHNLYESTQSTLQCTSC